MKYIKFILIICTLLMILVANKIIKNENMILTITESEIEVDSTNLNFSIHLSLYNNTNSNYSIYEFYNLCNYCNIDPIAINGCIAGINIEIYDLNKVKIYQEQCDDDNDPQISDALLRGEFDYVAQWIKVKFPDEEDIEEYFKLVEKRVRESKVLLKVDSSIMVDLDVSLVDIFLSKGVYELYAFYVMNDQIFYFIDKETKPDNLFFGIVKSNTVRLIIK